MMGQCSIFAFCFQVRGLVFLQRTNNFLGPRPLKWREMPFWNTGEHYFELIYRINDLKVTLPVVQKGISRHFRGRGPKKLFWGQVPAFLLLNVDTCLCYLCYLSAKLGQ